MLFSWASFRSADRDLRRKITEVLRWISSFAKPDDVILLIQPGAKTLFQFEFPIRFGAKPTRIDGEESKATFRIHVDTVVPLEERDWRNIFSTPSFEVFEARRRHASELPLRFGLEKEEQEELFLIARSALKNYFAGSLMPNVEQSASPRLLGMADVGVALWLDGAMRGCVVVSRKELARGVADAAVLACSDLRFKPITEKECERVAVEIMLPSNLHVSLTRGEIKKNVIYTENGYSVVGKDEIGWLFPVAFNGTRRFSRLEDFLTILVSEKAHLESAYQKTPIMTFSVEDKIQLKPGAKPLSLRGPRILERGGHDVHSVARKAADWLLSIQKDDGSIPPIIDPFRAETSQMDWTRLAFTAWALAEYGQTLGSAADIEAAKRIYQFLSESFRRPLLKLEQGQLFLAYLGQLALTLGEREFASSIRNLLDPKPLASSIITKSQVAAFKRQVASADNLKEKTDLEQDIANEFRKNVSDRKPIALAAYAELINLFWEVDRSLAEEVLRWIKSFQYSNGSFPESTVTTFCYTRGTGKILEVLALDPLGNKESINSAIKWLASFQYDEGSLFFVPPSSRGKLIGALRHDDQNPEAWIDASGHVLLAASRLCRKIK